MNKRSRIEPADSDTMLESEYGPEETELEDPEEYELEDSEEDELETPATAETHPIFTLEERQAAAERETRRQANALPLANWLPDRFNAQTREPLPSDRFKVKALFGPLLDAVTAQRNAGTPEPEILTRATLAVAGIKGIESLVRRRTLQPLDDGCPEIPGVAPYEIREAFAELHANDPARKMTCGLKLIEHWPIHPVAQKTDGSDTDLFRQSVASCLEPSPAALGALLDGLETQNAAVHAVVLELLDDPQRFKGKKALPHAGRLATLAFGPLFSDETRLTLLDVLEAISPPMSEELFAAALLAVGSPAEETEFKAAAARLLYRAAFTNKAA